MKNRGKVMPREEIMELLRPELLVLRAKVRVSWTITLAFIAYFQNNNHIKQMFDEMIRLKDKIEKIIMI